MTKKVFGGGCVTVKMIFLHFFVLPKYSVLSLDRRNEETKMTAKSRTNEESVCRMGKNECVFVCTLLKDS